MAKVRRRSAEQFEAPADNGFFGPGSVTWKVWGYPTSVLTGFQRSVTVEELDPHLIAAVEASGGVRERPRSRYDRTLRYFALMVFGDTATTAKAADVLVKVHSKAIGTDPVTGRRYDANASDSQLWIHMTAWHSILYCYERFGPGPLPPEEEAQYWLECARSAELQTIDPADVPRSREEVRAYFEQWRPRLAGSEAAQSMTAFLLRGDVIFPEDMPWWQRPAGRLLARAVRMQTIATYPGWMRRMFGLRQPRIVDWVVTVLSRPAYRVVHRLPRVQLTIMRIISPSTVPIAAVPLLGIPARSQVTMTPREAQARYGYDVPARAHLDLRARQEQRVFGSGEAPSDEGLVESESQLGSLDPGRAGIPA
ncbi:oxygenase MpaB family protein [Nocardioides terrisoli]|uniref:oxygenase MpaB family protein n=1 Tax=Nocardioides terrisoli TaxID=3388267 RepID=UPI00287B6DFC|nr:oxygenase MpaB family protein [Nocardioides marmorisolisilvae]